MKKVLVTLLAIVTFADQNIEKKRYKDSFRIKIKFLFEIVDI